MTINCSIFAGFYYFFFNLNADIPIRLNPGSFYQRLKMSQVILNFVLKLTPLSNGRINWVYGVLRVSYVSFLIWVINCELEFVERVLTTKRSSFFEVLIVFLFFVFEGRGEGGKNSPPPAASIGGVFVQ